MYIRCKIYVEGGVKMDKKNLNEEEMVVESFMISKKDYEDAKTGDPGDVILGVTIGWD